MLSGPVLCKWCHLTLSEQLARAGARKVAEIRPNAMSRGRRWSSFSVLEDPMSMSRGDPLPWRFVVRYGTALLLAARWAARTAGYRRTANPRGQPAPGCCAGFSFWPSQWAVLPLSRWRRWRTAPATPTAVSPSVITGCTRPGTPASGRCRPRHRPTAPSGCRVTPAGTSSARRRPPRDRSRSARPGAWRR